MEDEMQYLLMLYVDQNGWTKLSKAQQEQGAASAERSQGRLRQGSGQAGHRMADSS